MLGHGRHSAGIALAGVLAAALTQARWTTTITLSGRVERCGSLREALDSL